MYNTVYKSISCVTIKRIIELSGYNKTEFAKEVGVVKRTVSRWLSKGYKIQSEPLKGIVRVCEKKGIKIKSIDGKLCLVDDESNQDGNNTICPSDNSKVNKHDFLVMCFIVSVTINYLFDSFKYYTGGTMLEDPFLVILSTIFFYQIYLQKNAPDKKRIVAIIISGFLMIRLYISSFQGNDIIKHYFDLKEKCFIAMIEIPIFFLTYYLVGRSKRFDRLTDWLLGNE